MTTPDPNLAPSVKDVLQIDAPVTTGRTPDLTVRPTFEDDDYDEDDDGDDAA